MSSPISDFNGLVSSILAERDALRAELAQVVRDEHSAVERGNRLAGDTQTAEARVATLESAMRQIRHGKVQADNEHPMGEWFSMAGRFMNIARAALEETKP